MMNPLTTYANTKPHDSGNVKGIGGVSVGGVGTGGKQAPSGTMDVSIVRNQARSSTLKNPKTGYTESADVSVGGEDGGGGGGGGRGGRPNGG